MPFRRSQTLSLSDAITQYISSKYDQHPDMFADDLMIIDRLRNAAINVQEPHVSGISRLVTYAAQLKWLGGKFPVDVSADALAAERNVDSCIGGGGVLLVSGAGVQRVEAW